MENDSGEKKIEFLNDDFELQNLSKAQLDLLCHAISRYHANANTIPCHANSHKLSVHILGCGVSDEEKMYLTRKIFSDSIEKMEPLL